MDNKENLTLAIAGISFFLAILFLSTFFKIYFATMVISYEYLVYFTLAFVVMIFSYWISNIKD